MLLLSKDLQDRHWYVRPCQQHLQRQKNYRILVLRYGNGESRKGSYKVDSKCTKKPGYDCSPMYRECVSYHNDSISHMDVEERVRVKKKRPVWAKLQDRDTDRRAWYHQCHQPYFFALPLLLGEF